MDKMTELAQKINDAPTTREGHTVALLSRLQMQLTNWFDVNEGTPEHVKLSGDIAETIARLIAE